MPPGWARAVSPYGASRSQGKSGRFSGTSRALGRERGHDRVVPRDDADLRGAAGGSDLFEEFDVGLVVVGPLLGQVVFVVDRLDGADRLAGTAVDALVGVDVEHPVTLVDAVDGALVDTGAILQIDAGQGDDVGHSSILIRSDARGRTAAGVARGWVSAAARGGGARRA